MGSSFRRCCVLAVLALASAPVAVVATAAAPADDLKVIVHPSNPMAELTVSELSRLFLKKTRVWPERRPVQPVEPASPELRGRFAERIHRKSLEAVESHWRQLIFSGRDVPPLQRPDEAGVVAFCRAEPGAIGYVSASADLTGVKVLVVTPDPP